MKTKRGLRLIVFCLAVFCFVYSTYNLYAYWREGEASNSMNQNIVAEVVATVDATAPESEPNPLGMDTSEPEETQGEYAPITVDFEALGKDYPDIIAWLYCEDTQINYPVVQSEDNDYYLHRLPDGQENAAGTIFMDYRNCADFSDFNSILYGHHMKNGSMFGSLVGYKIQSYYDEHPFLYLLTPEQNYKVEMVAGYIAGANAEVYGLREMEESKKEFIEAAKEYSTFVTNSEYSVDDHYLTFSTCSYEYTDARYIVIGKLVKFA